MCGVLVWWCVQAATKIQASFRRFCAIHVLEKRKTDFLSFMQDQVRLLMTTVISF